MSCNSDFSQDIDNKDKLKEVFKYLETIKKEHRDILVYRIWDDLSYKEISVVLGIMDNNEYIKYLKDTEASNKKNFPSSLKKSLKELNSNLFFLNQNFPYDMPVLKTSSYYSFALSNLKQINLFPEEEVALFPDFYLENSVVNNKSPKKIMKKP